MPGRWSRALRWSVWCAVAVCLASMVLMPAAEPALASVALMLATAAGTVACARGVTRTTGRARRVWSLSTAGLACWAVVEVYVGIPSILSGVRVDSPLWADLLTVLGLCMAIAAMFTIPSAPTGFSSRLRLVLDGMTVASATLGTVWIVVISALINSTDSVLEAFAEMGSTIGSVGAFVVALLVLGGQRQVRGSALTYIAGGLATLAGSQLMTTFAHAAGATYMKPWIHGVLIVAATLLAFARTGSLPDDSDRPWDASTPFGRLVPYAPVVVYVFAVVVITTDGGRLQRPSAWAGAIMVLCVLARQFLALQLNAQLTSTLEQQRAALAHEAFHDRLTGLPNRAMLNDSFAGLDAATPPGAVPALLMIDLDGFKEVNDTLGHAAGDELLVEVAARLRAAVGAAPGGSADAAGRTPPGAAGEVLPVRLGGDEFAILLPEGGDRTAYRIAELILRSLAAPIGVADRVVTVGASIGVALRTDAGAQARDLLRLADVALYRAKADGKNRWRRYHEDMTTQARRQRRLETELADAVRRESLELAYQPIVDLADGAVLGLEALVRWRHPALGLLLPEEFLPTAEAMGLLPTIDHWVLRQACAQARVWRETRPDLTISVNVSAAYLATGRLPDDVAETLALTGLAPSALTVELVESALVTNLAAAGMTLTRVRDLGVHVAVDDFGVGFSTLAYLHHLPVDTLKIDRSFAGNLSVEGPVMDLILGLGRRMDMRVVAEGVEHAAQADRLRDLRCGQAQGFLYAQPVPAFRVADLLAATPTAPAGPARPVVTVPAL